MMKKAMVLGASGGMGQAIVRELVNRKIEVVAFARNEAKLQTLFGHDDRVAIYPGDAQNKDELKKGLPDIDVIFHALNVPYSQWEQKLEKIMNNVVELAKEKNIKLAIVDNVYAYGEGNGKEIREDYPKQPHTKKGKIRLRLEKIVKNSGVSALFAHFPDFYGPGAEKSMLHYFFASVRQDKTAMFIGNQTVKREYIYTPDGAKAIITLAQHPDAYGQHWNIPATDVISGKEIIALVREVERFTKKVFTVKKGLISFLGLFDKDMKEVVEMLYLTEDPVVLSGDKYEKHIGTLPRTPYREGIKQTLSYYKGEE
ncbi:SDR family NAD(P)-dependent oxidoreductase [Gracilibacillus suaedae]|uniref:SDR family NAD(P)-dependent oxidoreductase n=1 Tax=Gracilibacillus suaedae TaxID=2820273 RepID=UPI001ABE7994|nr:SDR family NAD(P)-dependent oxidoreductase [Gracilibacillus suaedae]